MPFTKCNIEESSETLETIDEITLQTINMPLLPEVEGFEYKCQSLFEKAFHMPPN